MILDTSAVLAMLLDEPASDAVGRAIGSELWFACESLPFEVGNALSAMVKRRKLYPEDALAVMHEFVRGLPQLALIETSWTAAMNVAVHFDVYAYDAYVLACAERTGQSLLTLDMPMRAIATRMGLTVVEVR